MRLTALTLLACLLLPGCADRDLPTDGPPSDPLTGLSSAPTMAAVAAPILPQRYSSELILSGCSGVVTEGRYPDDSVEMVEHPTWPEYEYPEPESITVALLDCARLKLGPFERPVRIITETDDLDAYSPETCHPDPETRPPIVYLNFVASIGVTDPEVAEFMRIAYGLPAYVVEAEVTVDGSGVLPEQVWRWAPPGHEPSELRTPVDPLPRAERIPFDWRWYWFNETATSALDLHWEFESPLWENGAFDSHETAARVSYGRLEPPMQAGGDRYAGHGEYQTT